MANDFKFEDNSEKVKAEIENAIEASLTKIGMLIKSSAQVFSRVDTGGMRDRIGYKVENESVIIGSPDDYSLYNEFGTGEFAENGSGRKGGWRYQTPDGKWHYTVGMRPQPFIRPAFRTNKKNVRKIIADELEGKFK